MTIHKNRERIVPFAAIDLANRPSRKSGISWSTGDAQISKDGAAFGNTTNLPVEIGTTGRYKITLTAAEMDADSIALKITNAAMDDSDVFFLTGSQPSGAVVTDGGNSSAAFKTDLSESTDSYWVDALLLFTDSSGLLNQIKKVTSYDGTTKIIGVGSAFTGTPSVGDRFILINI
jgi:hypothetical protein